MKRCSQCKITKEYSQFRKHTKSKDGLQSGCKMCQKKKRAEWHVRNPGLAAKQSKEAREKNPEYYLAAQKKWRDNNPDTVKNNTIKKRYGIDLEIWNNLFKNQEGKCLICLKHQSDCTTQFAVDHCHKTKKVRGLLCVTCNRAIGLLGDDPSRLRKAAEYLEVSNPLDILPTP